MKFPPFALFAAACAAALLVSAQVVPTVKAQSQIVPEYRVQVQWEKAAHTVSGLIITGSIINTGRKPLIYTKVLPILEDRNGKTVYIGNGYLTVSPLHPGQSAEFRACEPDTPVFSQYHITLRESGSPVLVMEKTNLLVLHGRTVG